MRCEEHMHWASTIGGEKDWAVHRSQCVELELTAVHVSHKTGEAVMMLWRRTYCKEMSVCLISTKVKKQQDMRLVMVNRRRASVRSRLSREK